jgi:bifunctional non-homologous end joining protein LigD
MNERCLPMLAVRSEPFDSTEYLFEVKWNGIRALAARNRGGWDLWGRERADYRLRYPELKMLAQLPQGTILDGELILAPDRLPDLDALLARHQLTHPGTIQRGSQDQPVTYMVFDLLAHQGRSLLGQPLLLRRQLAQELLERCHEPRLQFSEGIVGPGRLFFEQAVRQGQEGVMAKHLASRYLPGKRSTCWLKIKPVRRLPCVIIGWQPGTYGLRGLLVAAPWTGRLRYLANVCTGFTNEERQSIPALLAGRGRTRPVVRCSHRGLWVEPELFCRVGYLEWTRAGRLRGASFRGLLTS